MAPKSAFSLESLDEALPTIFNQVQGSLANHKKNCVTLYKLHKQAAGYIESTSKATVKLVGEEAFQHVFMDMVSRVLNVKKGVASADRIVRFIGSYVKFINEKVRLEKAEQSISTARHAQQTHEDEDDDEDTFVSRFVSRLLGWILRGFLAKDKNVRFRSVFIVSEMILWLGQLDIDEYEALRENLVERLCDKETSIRAQTVVALARLSGNEDPNEVEEGQKTISELLTDVLVYDDEPEVRRATLINLPLNRSTVDVLLSCSRDVDLLTRKVLYSGVFFNKLETPRSLTLVQREKLIKDGLGDREASVRAAVGKLIMKWFDQILAEHTLQEEGSWEGDEQGIMKALTRFLELFDVVGNETIAMDAVNAIFVLKPEFLETFQFSDLYWEQLTPESASLARAFINHCDGITGDKRLEEVNLPMVTAFAFYLQSLYNKLTEALQTVETAEMLHKEDEHSEAFDELHKVASILSSILSIAVKLDYGDEIGRRKAFAVIKDMLTHPTLPLDLVDPCMDIMKAMLPSEREYIRVIVEIVIDLRDTDEELNDMETQDKSFSDTSQSASQKERSFRRAKPREEMSKEEREAADLNDLRCLMICNSVLERISGPFEDNSTLQGILDDLVVPSIQRKEIMLREKALMGLGLCSLIAKKMALGSFQLFSNECIRAPEPVRVIVLRIIFDLLVMYEKEFFGKSEEMDAKLIAFLLSIMETELGKDEPSAEILATLCMGFSKLLLLNIVNDPRMLLCLLVAYVSPDSAGNQEARQCLSYFFTRYSIAHWRNKVNFQSIFMTALDTITHMSSSLDDDQSMISPEKFGEMLLLWTDPQFGSENDEKIHIQDNHANTAIQILLNLYDSDRTDAEFKTLCHLLNQQLYWPKDLELRTIHMIDLLIGNHEKQCPFEVAATTKAFERFKTRFNKIYATHLAEINPRKYVHDEEVLKLCEAMNVDVPDSDREMGSASPPRRAASAEEQDEHVASDGGDNKQSAEPESEEESEDADAQSIVYATPDNNDENIKNLETTPMVSTPKKKGTKRLRTPGSGILTPAETKRNRTRTSLASRASDLESESDGSISPTPVKTKPRAAQSKRTTIQVKEPIKVKKGLKPMKHKASAIPTERATTSRPTKTTSKKVSNGSKTKSRKQKLPTPPPISDEEEEEEVVDNEAELSGQSSDDLANYSDD